ncbi:MAG: HAMP domain-containing histidine kinase [Clostridia bacterium]|nr:HAMP domain-containing histidine kinase [Clostridia bacterium]
MKLLRNPEIRRLLIILGILCTCATVGAFIWNAGFGIFTLALCLVLITVFLIFTHQRYKRLAALSDTVNRILHGDNSLSFDGYDEGELGVLQSELYKMTVRLREQQQALLDDKIFLADSIADISHQIRTPLTSINLIVSLLDDPDLPEQTREQHMRELYVLLGRIDWLITALLKISKLDAGTAPLSAQTMPLQALIERAAAPLQVPTELRGQQLCLRARGQVTCDPAWTAEALGNIIKNCMEHTPEGGRILVDAKETALYSEITVTDSGCGIDEEDLPHLFERFYKGKHSSDEGFGIGLALARTIVTAQNGTLKAQNAPEGGAQFIMRFYKGTI